MESKNGIKERMVGRNDIGDDRESEENEESEEVEEFIPMAEQSPWEEAGYIIATKGSIKGVKV